MDDVKDVKSEKSHLFTIMLVLDIIGIIIIIIIFVIGIYALLNRQKCDECQVCPNVNCALSGSPYIDRDLKYYRTSSGTCMKFNVNNGIDFDVQNNSNSVFVILFRNTSNDSNCPSSSDSSRFEYFQKWAIWQDKATYLSNGLFISPTKYLSLYQNLAIAIADTNRNDQKVSFNGGTPSTTIDLNVPDPVNQKLSIVVSSDETITVDIVNKT